MEKLASCTARSLGKNRKNNKEKLLTYLGTNREVSDDVANAGRAALDLSKQEGPMICRKSVSANLDCSIVKQVTFNTVNMDTLSGVCSVFQFGNSLACESTPKTYKDKLREKKFDKIRHSAVKDINEYSLFTGGH